MIFVLNFTSNLGENFKKADIRSSTRTLSYSLLLALQTLEESRWVGGGGGKETRSSGLRQQLFPFLGL